MKEAPPTLVTLPPSIRSRATMGLTDAAAAGRFELQVCRKCAAVQYPPREACHRCLSSLLDWKVQSGGAELLSETTLRHSHDAFFRARLPIRLGLVRLDSGPTAVVYLDDGVAVGSSRVTVGVRLDKAGQGVLVAFAEGGVMQAQAGHLREMSCDARGRKVLVTDAGSTVGVELVNALVDAGAEVVWAGYCPEVAEQGGVLFGGLKQVRLVPLDVMSEASVDALAAQVGSQVDVLIDNAGVYAARGSVGSSAALPGPPVESAHAEMDTNYDRLLRLARAFGPAMRAAAVGASVGSPSMAWVNLFSIYDLLASLSQSTFAASKVSAYSFSRALRAEMRPAGIRVVNVFPGSLDDERNRELPPPKIAPVALARAVVSALQDGVQEVFPGEFAQDVFAWWRNNPQLLEHEVESDR